MRNLRTFAHPTVVPRIVSRIRGADRAWRTSRRAAGVAAVLAAALVLVPATAQAQPTQASLPFTGLQNPTRVAVDAHGDLFVADYDLGEVLELPSTGDGTYGAQVVLPFTGLSEAEGVVVDASGDVFVANLNHDSVIELPSAGNGTYGAQVTLPFTSLSNDEGLALDGSGDLFATSGNTVVELPSTGDGTYGTQVTLPFAIRDFVFGVAVDDAGDVFAAAGTTVYELPAGATSSSQQVTLPFTGVAQAFGVRVDPGGDVFLSDLVGTEVAMLPSIRPGVYGPQVSVPFTGLSSPQGMAFGADGSVFVSNNRNRQVVELPRYLAPDAPTGATATAGDGQAAVAFTSPATGPGGANTSYTVTATDTTNSANGGQSATGTASPLTVTGLTNGDAYTFAVTATDHAGYTGPASAASAPVTPVAPQPQASITITGARSYADAGTISKDSLKINPATGAIRTINGTVELPGADGGTTTVRIAAVRIGSHYFGAISVRDPGAHLHVAAVIATTNLHRTPDGQVTGTATGLSGGHLFTITYTL